MKECIVCNSHSEPLITINVRQEGKIVIQRFVHPDCYAGNEVWIKKQVQGKNPKFFVMGKKYDLS